jgi:hypothetical protein
MASKKSIKNGVPVVCGSCKALLGGFRAYDDNGGVVMVCPKCKADCLVPNGLLLEIEEDPSAFDLPVPASKV